jgi:methionyl aminopeptidase
MPECLKHDNLAAMREAGKVVSSIFKEFRRIIKPGITTKDIEVYFDQRLSQYPGMVAAFKGFSGYPASVCVSVNEEVIHGIPSSRVIKDADLVSVDLGIKYKGLFVDSAYTYTVGRASKLANKLAKVTLGALNNGIKHARIGASIGDVGFAIQRFIEKRGFSVIRKFVGHGIGTQLHMPPEVPNFGKRGQGEKLYEGMVIAIEPMVSAGSFEIDVLADGWTARTKDRSLSAHFEHTVAITKKGPWILTQ